jgi:RNA recognition motif-containing protein
MRFLPDPNNQNRNRGFCFLYFENPMIAREAYDKLCRNIIIDGSCLTVDWADEIDSEKDLNKVQIHLSGLNEDTNVEDLHTVFTQYGQIINIKLSKDIEGIGRKDYGFITYSNEDEAAKAINEFKWKEYFESPINIQYARKISSIIKHKQKMTGDMLDKKRKRDNLYRNVKNEKESDSDDNQHTQGHNPSKKNEKILNVCDHI